MHKTIQGQACITVAVNVWHCATCVGPEENNKTHESVTASVYESVRLSSNHMIVLNVKIIQSEFLQAEERRPELEWS